MRKRFSAIILAFVFALCSSPLSFAIAPSPDMWIVHNMSTGQTAYADTETTEFVESTEAYIPVGVEIATPTMPNTVIPPDERIQITNVNAYPYCAIVYLELTFGSVTAVGSGFMVGPNVVLTAGLCVYDGSYGWATSIKVKAGGNNSSFSSVTVNSTSIHSVAGWVNQGLADYDYGIITLPTNLGYSTGTFSIADSTNYIMNNRTVNVYGYPGDKAAGTLWYAIGTVLDSTQARIWYNTDTAGGQSGGPVSFLEAYTTAVGIHTRGTDTYNRNSATRINLSIVNYVNGFL